MKLQKSRKDERMSLSDDAYRYIEQNYQPGEPVFLADLDIPEMTQVAVRQQIGKLVEEGRLRRFDTGIYFIPKKTSFRSGSTLSMNDVIREKYLLEDGKVCGYVGGLLFANRLGLTTQVPALYEVFTNKASKEYRETKPGGIRVVVRRPYCRVDDGNVVVLQFLDLLKDVTAVSEVEGKELTERLLGYVKRERITFEAMDSFLPFYPERIYRNMYEAGLLVGRDA